jgi:DNA-directed RNA polymerase I subunit RPA1
MFMDYVLRLLRAQCAYCHYFKMKRKDVNAYVCKLRLLQYGLLIEAENIDAIGENYNGLALPGVPQVNVEDAGTDADDGLDGLMKARNTYVRRAITEHSSDQGRSRMKKHEGASTMRRTLVKNFLADMVTPKVCARCDGISPSFRKDRFVKIFQKPLAPKDRVKMATKGFQIKDAMAIRQSSNIKPTKPVQRPEDGVDAALDDLEEEDGGISDEGSGDDLDENGDLIPAPGKVSISSPAIKTTEAAQEQVYLNSQEVLERLRLLFDHEQEVLQLVMAPKLSKRRLRVGPEMLFVQTLLVPPNRFRPEARTGDSQITEAEQNSLYKKILKSCSALAEISREIAEGPLPGRRVRDVSALYDTWTNLQDCVNSLFDNTKSPNLGRTEEGIKQKLEKKEGLFRMNMMGKRVNYAARSVISPDPNIEASEIGVPPVFAVKLTFPEPVTSHNFRELHKAIVNGPDKWPGAGAVEFENGHVVNLRNKSQEERVAIANRLLAPSDTGLGPWLNKKVFRHITNGDVVLMNRQPTLHKPSIMGHRVRVLKGERTIRMHYANCNTYNADFDGDEMNMHFPQNEIARSEALMLADTNHQYISGTQGKPLRGLIQDHLSVSVALCAKDTFLDKAAYQQLVYSALRPENGHITGERIELIPPAILKPAVRWTGKQVITTLLKNIRPPHAGDLWMSGKSQVPGTRWGNHVEEGKVEFRDGELICGILDKAQLGPASGGLIHAVHEVYGPASAGKLLSSIGRLLTRYLNMRAFTCGMDDLRLTETGEAARRAALSTVSNIGVGVATNYVNLLSAKPSSRDPELLNRLEEVMRDDTKQEGLDMLMTKGGSELSNKITEACLPRGLEKQFPENQMQAMTTSGAKGGLVNANLISCNLGQQVLEGRRVPLMVTGKSLPSYEAFDSDIRAGGYIIGRFLTGIRPQEYYFHHMAGREGLIDTAVKTARSGYLQRCLIKGMEGLQVAYDGSVRDSDGTLVQFLYGEDGLDITKQKYLTDFKFLLNNLDSQLQHVNFSEPQAESLFQHKDDLVKQIRQTIRQAKADPACPVEPVNSLFNPYQFAFLTSERFFGKVADYLKDNPDGLLKEKSKEAATKADPLVRARLNKKGAEKVFAAKYLRSLVEPGEAVGIVAGQSVGEPSTQMTLNTFHLAGHSAKNVTLGIPRLREILMTASAKISTPSMTLVLNPQLSEEDGENFAKSISIRPLSHVVDEVTVMEKTGKGVGFTLAKMYHVRIKFFRSADYIETYNIGIADVLNAIEQDLLPRLSALIKRETARRSSSADNEAIPEVGKSAGATEISTGNPRGGPARRKNDNDDFSDDDDDEEDATALKKRANRDDEMTYDDNDEDDDKIQAQMEEEAGSDYGESDGEEEDEGFGGSSTGSPAPTTEDEDKAAQDIADALSRTREERVKSKHQRISEYRCDELKGEWCRFTLEFGSNTPKMLMLGLVQEAIKKCVIQQIPGVDNCTFEANARIKNQRTGKEEQRHVVHTEGANVVAMQQYGDYLDPNRISTNDIARQLEIYGVEACRANIMLELANVFASHGIGVDTRHLNLIADYMTRNGCFTPFNRMGLQGNVSPFTKMSFETTVMFLKDAVMDGDWDELMGPSSRLVTGRPGRIGTGGIDVLTRCPTMRA